MNGYEMCSCTRTKRLMNREEKYKPETIKLLKSVQVSVELFISWSPATGEGQNGLEFFHYISARLLIERLENLELFVLNGNWWKAIKPFFLSFKLFKKIKLG